MQRSRTALSVRYCRELAAHNRHATHTATPESSNPHNVAPVPRGFVLGRFPYAGPVPRRATFEARRPKTFTMAAIQTGGTVFPKRSFMGTAANGCVGCGAIIKHPNRHRLLRGSQIKLEAWTTPPKADRLPVPSQAARCHPFVTSAPSEAPRWLADGPDGDIREAPSGCDSPDAGSRRQPRSFVAPMLYQPPKSLTLPTISAVGIARRVGGRRRAEQRLHTNGHSL